MIVQLMKKPPAMQETWVRSQVRKIPWRRKWQPTPVFLPGEFHGQRSLADYSPWVPKESDTTEQLHFHFHDDPKSRNDYKLWSVQTTLPLLQCGVLKCPTWGACNHVPTPCHTSVAHILRYWVNLGMLFIRC